MSRLSNFDRLSLLRSRKDSTRSGTSQRFYLAPIWVRRKLKVTRGSIKRYKY